MKRILLGLMAMLFCCSSMAQVDLLAEATPTPVLKSPSLRIKQFKSAIRDKIIKEQKIELSYDVIKNEYNSKNCVYEATIKKNLNDSFPIGFIYDGKKLAFEFTESKWLHNAESKIVSAFNIYDRVVTEVSKSIDSATVVCVDAKNVIIADKKRVDFNKVDNYKLSAEMSPSKFKKIVEIDSNDLIIPETAEYLELVFELDSDMNLPLDGVIKERWELAEDCWLEPAKAGIVGTTEYITIEHSMQRIDGKVFYKKRVPVSYLVGVIYTDADITFGSAVIFNSATSICSNPISLTSTTFVVCYGSTGGFGIIGTMSGTVITFGSVYTFNTGTSSVEYSQCTKINSSKFVVSYRDSNNSGYGSSCVGTVSSGVITFGSEYVFNSGATRYINATLVSTDKFVVVYRDEGHNSYGSSCAGTVLGTVITFGIEYEFDHTGGTLCTYPSCDAYDTDKFILCWKTKYPDDRGNSYLGSVSGTVISYANSTIFNTGLTDFISVTVLSSTIFVVCYADTANSSYGTARVGTIGATSITYGNEYVFNSGTTSRFFAV